MANQGQPYTDEEAEQVRQLADEGLNYPQIGERLNISRNRVKRICDRYNIPAVAPQRRRQYQKPLPPAELARLRRMVGWRPDVDYAKDEHDDQAVPVAD